MNTSVGRENVIKIREGVRPEGGPVGLIEVFDGLVFVAEPIVKCGNAFVAKAVLSVVFVGNMPQNERGVNLVSFGQFRVDRPAFFALNRRGSAVVMSAAVALSRAICIHAANFRIGSTEPGGFRAAGGSHDRVRVVGCNLIHDCIKPIEREFAFFGLERGPGEYANGCSIAARQLHEAHIFIPNIRCGDPLIGIVIPAV